MKIFVILATVAATSFAAPHYGPVINQWPSTQMLRTARSSTAADFAVEDMLEEDPTARTHKLLKKPLFSHHHVHHHSPYHHFRENEENVAAHVQENKNLLQNENKVELDSKTEKHVENNVMRLKEKEINAPIQDHAREHPQMSKNNMPSSELDDQTQMTKKMADDMMMRKSQPQNFEARGAYDAGAVLGGGSVDLSSGGSGSVIGVFSNAHIGGCAVPVLLSCSPSIVSGSLSKPHSYGYGAGAPAYRTSEDFHMHDMQGAKKLAL